MSIPEDLDGLLKSLAPLAVAYSGGLDSRFLAHAARCAGVGDTLRLLHIAGSHVSPEESREAEEWAGGHGFDLTVIHVNPLDEPEVRAGSRERCYFCKRRLFTALIAALDGLPHTLCDGGNASDLQAYRPGLRALRELGVRSPLAEAGMAKPDIRRVAAASGMDRPDQRARPCLLTRFAYGLAPTPEALASLADAEQAIARALAGGPFPQLPDFRLRLVRAAPLAARLPFAAEVHVDTALEPDLRETIAEAVLAHGFPRPAFVIMETVSGHYDRGQEHATSGDL